MFKHNKSICQVETVIVSLFVFLILTLLILYFASDEKSDDRIDYVIGNVGIDSRFFVIKRLLVRVIFLPWSFGNYFTFLVFFVFLVWC